MHNNDHQKNETSEPMQDTSVLGIVSTYIGITSYIIIGICLIFLFYQATKPCTYGHRCEGIPFFELLFVLASIFVVISLFAGFLAYLAPKKDTEFRMQKRQQGLSLNFSLFWLCLLYLGFGIIMTMS